MIDSRFKPKPIASALLWLLIGAALLLGCGHTRAGVAPKLLMPMQRQPAWLPLPVDQAAARLAASALVTNRPALNQAEAEIDAIPKADKPEDMDALAQDVVNATLDDPRAYRKASASLTRGFGTDPGLEARLDQVVDNDPLALAKRRNLDTWEHLWARTFNAASKPIGQAIFSGFALAPMTIATSTAHYLASFSNDEPLSTTDRQALVLHREYLARHPDAPDAEKIQAKVDKAEKKLTRTMQRRRLRAAEMALDSGNPKIAVLEAKRALFWGPHEDAETLRQIAQEDVEQIRALHQASLTAPGELTRADRQDHALAVELLNTSSTGDGLSDEMLGLLWENRNSPEGDDALFIFAIAQKESGFEEESWRTLEHLAQRDPMESTMVRHARHLIDDPWQNPYTAYRRMKARKTADQIRWRLFADYADGPKRYPNLPEPLGLALEGPGIATAFITSPMRLVFGRWKKGPDFNGPTAVLAYRYLDRYPNGQHNREIIEWLFAYEQERGNQVAALRLADFMEELDPDDRAALAEAASAQVMAAADRMHRFDRRNQTLRHAATEYPDTDTGVLAGKRIRWEIEDYSAQQIRVTRSFLVENPRVAGPNGLGINPSLIDGELTNGELHAMGVTLVGGRVLRFHLLAESGEDTELPEDVDQAISTERLAQLASVLDETSRRNQLIDPDDTLEHDADRDRFLERARLGLVQRPDKRPTAQSTYVYQSMRERYGVVRGRESILPFDLVFSGNLQDLQLGAYPKWRPPKATPDAFLYR